MKVWHIRLKTGLMEESFHITQPTVQEAQREAMELFRVAHEQKGVPAISCEVVLTEQCHI